MHWLPILAAAVVLAGLALIKRMSFVSKEAARRHLADGALVIDVRSPEEFRSGSVLEAINIPLGELGDKIRQRVQDKNRVLLVHCLSGGRSALARQQLKRLGYAHVFNLGSLRRARAVVESARRR